MKFSLHQSMLLVVGVSLVAALVPAGLILDRRLSNELREKAREDLRAAEVLMADHDRTRAEALQRRAQAIAAQPLLRRALARGSFGAARGFVASSRDSLVAEMVLLGPEGELLDGPVVPDSLAQLALTGNSIVRYVNTEGGLRRIALSPVPPPPDSIAASLERDERLSPVGVTGLTMEVGPADAGALAGLSRSKVVIVGPDGGVVAASGDSLTAELVADAASRLTLQSEIETVWLAGHTWWVTAAPLDAAGHALFAFRHDDALAVLPPLRRQGAMTALTALAGAMILAGLFAGSLAQPVEALATAADRLASGDRDAPIRRSRIREVDRVGQAFGGMRRTLAARMTELEHANRELAQRQNRLKMLQAEMIRRDRMAASGRLVTELAHEIRNPVASVRNCLEIVRRKLAHDDREFADLAIDELLRMHELAEHVLDLNRPAAPGPGDVACDPVAPARNVAELVEAGRDDGCRVMLDSARGFEATIPQDALKQVLLNLVENAREAMAEGGIIEIRVEGEGEMVGIEVRDEGPGIAEPAFPNIFDPFFTTKGGVRGVGLGLFIADGIVRRYGGSITAFNRTDRSGAIFRIELPRARVEAREVV